MKIFAGKWYFGIEWGTEANYKYVQLFNYLAKEDRYWGRDLDAYYDGWLPNFGFWFFNIAWMF